MDDEYLARLGNIDGLKDQHGKTYRFIRRSAKPVGLLTHPRIVLKLYHMLRETEPLPANLVTGLETFLTNEVDSGRVEPKQGIGFAILSQGFLSINVWGRGNVLFTQTYTVERNPPELSPEPLEKTGVACTWENKIMHHEYEAWHRYLRSPMSVVDKQAYLDDVISGDLSP